MRTAPRRRPTARAACRLGAVVSMVLAPPPLAPPPALDPPPLLAPPPPLDPSPLVLAVPLGDPGPLPPEGGGDAPPPIPANAGVTGFGHANGSDAEAATRYTVWSASA
jgi:hypothetical protein